MANSCSPPDTLDDFVRALPLKKIPGVGKVTQAKLAKFGLITCQDIRDFGEAALSQHFGSFANHLFQRAWGARSKAFDHRMDPKIGQC